MGRGMKRDRGSDEVSREYKRQVGLLNRAFSEWITNNKAANLAATWQDGCKDYLNHTQQLEAKFLTEGEVFTCGSGDCGQLGHGVENYEDLCMSRFRKVDKLAGKDLMAVACGGMHNVVVSSEDGAVWTWGCADDGTLGRDGDENYPAPVRSLQNKEFVISVSAGDSHTAALTLDGRVYIWGSYKDKDGRNWFRDQTGSGAFQKVQSEPILVEEVSDRNKHGGVRQITSGSGFTLALCGDGTVYSWGVGECGQLGRPVCKLKDDNDLYRKDDVLREHLTPAVMEYQSNGKVNNARFVAAGNHHSFIIGAVRSRVYACGLNQYGQLALDEGVDTTKLQHVTLLDDLGVSVMYGAEHSSMAITHDGLVYTFGRADNHQLGVPDHVDSKKAGGLSREPLLVKFDPPAKIVSGACGSFHCAAISDQGDVYTWGYGEMGQLGNSDKPSKATDETRPKLVQTSSKTGKSIKANCIAAGAQHTLILAPY